MASALNEIASKSKVSIWIDYKGLPIEDAVLSASEMLGLDPLEITCEGIAVIFVSEEYAENTLNALKCTPFGRDASIVGEVRSERPGYVLLKTEIGGTRVVDKPLGELIPRVC